MFTDWVMLKNTGYTSRPEHLGFVMPSPSTQLSQSMKDGYLGELSAREVDFQKYKLELEGLYMGSPGDDAIEKDHELKAKYESCVGTIDTLIPALATTVKSVKMAVES